MSSILDLPTVRDAVLRISVTDDHRLGEIGAISERTELLEGIVVAKVIKSPLHATRVQKTAKWLREGRRHFAQAYHIRQELPLTLSRSELEPDVAVVIGTEDDYRQAHPENALLVIEIAVTSLEVEKRKATIYAAADIPEYWIVIPEQSTIRIYRRPEAGRYQSVLDCSARNVQGEALPLAELFGR